MINIGAGRLGFCTGTGIGFSLKEFLGFEKIFSLPLIHMLKFFRIWFRFRGDIRMCKNFAVALTPLSQA